MLVFVYGTLTDPDRVASVLDDWSFAGGATLDGLHRVEGAYPTLAPGGRVEGRLLPTPEVDRLDAHEGVDAGLYVRVAVPLVGGTGDAAGRNRDAAAVYVGDPERLEAPATWSGSGPLGERVRAHIEAHDVVVRRTGDRQD